MVGEVAYVQLSGVSSSATLGLYAGIPPQELQQVVRVALNSHTGVCVGFQAARAGRKKRHSNSIQRLVPLSVACKVPELLTGRVSALFAPSGAMQPTVEPHITASKGSTDLQRLHKLLQALINELHLSSFESAMLYDLCEQQSAHVFTAMATNTSVDEKKRFLLRLLRPDDASKLEHKVQTPRRRDKKDQGVNALYTEVIAMKVAAIGRKVSNPPVQLQVLSLSREDWSITSLHQVGDTIKLLEVVEKLLDRHVVPEDHGAHLLALVLEQHPVLWSAFHSYKNDRSSLSDLETTAKRLAALKINLSTPRSTNPIDTIPKGMDTKENALVVVETLYDQRMLTKLELDILMALLTQNDSQVQQLIRDFQSSEVDDMAPLRDSLVRIVEELTMEVGDDEKAAAAFANGLDDAMRDDALEARDVDARDMVGWQRHLTVLLQQWHARDALTAVAARTLQRMIAQRHNLLESAYEVFATDADATELLDTLQRVAKLQHEMEASQIGQINGLDRGAERDVQLEDVVQQMQERGSIQVEDATGLLRLFHGGNEALRAANEAFRADDDVHELEETLLLVVKHARFGSDGKESEAVDEVERGCRVLAEFGRSGRLRLWQIQLLISLVKGRDPRFLAAMDVYEEDCNVEDFVETLVILAPLAAREQHFHALVHDWILSFVERDQLSRTEAERLLQLAEARDHRLAAAFVVFLSDNNKDGFVNQLRQCASVETQGGGEEERDGLALLKVLEEQHIVSCGECKAMEALLGSGETRMLAAMDVVAETQDVDDFVDTARRILARVQAKQAARDERAELAIKLAGTNSNVGEKEALAETEDVAACSVVAECGSLADTQALQEEAALDAQVTETGEQEQEASADEQAAAS